MKFPLFFFTILLSLSIYGNKTAISEKYFLFKPDVQAHEPNEIEEYYTLGTAFLKTKQYEKALKNFDLGFQKALAIKQQYFIALGELNLAKYYISTKNIPQALTLVNKALTSFTKQQNAINIAKCHYTLGKIYSQISDFEKALLHTFKALKINETLKANTELIKCATQIGAIYLLTGDFFNAEYNLKYALKTQEEIKDKLGTVLTYLNLGALYQKRSDYKTALNYFNSGLAILDKVYPTAIDTLDLLDNKSILLGNIGSTLRSQGDYHGSLNFLMQAFELKKVVNRDRSTAHTCNDIAETYMELNDFKKATEYALEAINYAKGASLNQEQWGYYLLSKCNYAQQKYKSSYENFQTYNILKDSIFTIQKATRINEMQIQYDTEKRNFQIAAQEKDIKLLKVEHDQKNQWIIFGGTGLITLFGFASLFRLNSTAKKKKRQQEQFSQELIEAQENERSRVALELHDSVGQQLMMLVRKAKKNGDQISESLSRNTLEQLRNISRNLHPSSIDQLGFTAAVKDLVNDFDALTDTVFHVDIDTIDKELNKKNELHLYRIFQESLSNMVKHANASHASITLKKEAKFIMLSIKDTGKGFDYNEKKKTSKSLGMRSLSERCNIMKAKLKIHSSPTKGTEILIFLPIATKF